MKDYIFNNLYLTKLYIFFYKKSINKRLNKFFTFAFQNEYHLLLNELMILFSMDSEIQLMKNIKRLLKNNKYKLIEKILFNQVEMDNFYRKIIYNVISNEIERNILKNNIVFFDFIFNNKVLKENHQILSEITEDAFYLEDVILFERSIKYFMNKYYKNNLIYKQEGKYNYLIRSIKEEKSDEIFEVIIKNIKEKEILLNVLFNLQPKQQSKLEILFKYNNNENMLKKEFEEIKRKTKNKNSVAINRVNKLLSHKKIINF
tara:strand:- start:1107 stop:1886 length:780 start_codon:yes stop_codon:yes gene_type:complete